MARKALPKELGETGAMDLGGQEEQEALKIPTNFRIAKITADKFRKVASEFTNQDSALNAMLSAYEHTELKKKLPVYAKDIEVFQQYADILIEKYVSILADYDSVEERAKREVGKLLESKDATINELQNVIGEMRGAVKERDDAVMRAKVSEQQIEKLEGEIKTLSDEKNRQRQLYDSSISDKEKINKSLREQITALQSQLQEFAELPDQLKAAQEELEAKEEELRNQSYQHQLSDVEKEKIMNTEMEKLRREHREALEALRNKYDERERGLQERYEKRIDSILQAGNAKEEPISAKK